MPKRILKYKERGFATLPWLSGKFMGERRPWGSTHGKAGRFNSYPRSMTIQCIMCGADTREIQGCEDGCWCCNHPAESSFKVITHECTVCKFRFETYIKKEYHRRRK